MRLRFGTVLYVWAALLALPASAQTAPPTESDAIVVTGNRTPPPRSEVYEQARELSRVSPYQTHEEALPRFETALCPGVLGLREELAEIMTARIRANASSLDLELAGKRCTPNLLVAFVDDGRSLLSNLEREQPAMFQLVSAPERREILEESGPVRVWSHIETRWASGAPVARFRGKEQLPSVKGRVDRMFLPTRRDIVSVLVVFEREAVLDMTAEQLADYATMRGLAHTRPATGAESMSTILSLFEEGPEGPPQLTSFDIGYLRSLYFWRAELPAATRFVGVQKRAAEAREELQGD